MEGMKGVGRWAEVRGTAGTRDKRKGKRDDRRTKGNGNRGGEGRWEARERTDENSQTGTAETKRQTESVEEKSNRLTSMSSKNSIKSLVWRYGTGVNGRQVLSERGAVKRGPGRDESGRSVVLASSLGHGAGVGRCKLGGGEESNPRLSSFTLLVVRWLIKLYSYMSNAGSAPVPGVLI